MYSILDSQLNVDWENDVGFSSSQKAAEFVLQHKPHSDSVYYIESPSGDIVKLVYGGVVWVPHEITVGKGANIRHRERKW